jgi:hypothetical protein
MRQNVGVTSSRLRFTLKTNDHHKTGVIGQLVESVAEILSTKRRFYDAETLQDVIVVVT